MGQLIDTARWDTHDSSFPGFLAERGSRGQPLSRKLGKGILRADFVSQKQAKCEHYYS